MAEQKTKMNDNSVDAYIRAVGDQQKQEDCRTIAIILEKITGHPPKMWGTSIIGFDSYHYKYASGHEGDAPLLGFSARKQNISFYLMGGFQGEDELLNNLGKYKTGKGCLYIKTLENINIDILEKLLEISIQKIREQIRKTRTNNP